MPTRRPALGAVALLIAAQFSLLSGGVVFLDRRAADDAIVDDTAQPYFELLEPEEMMFKTGQRLEGDDQQQRDALREIYRRGVGEFTRGQKRRLRKAVAQLEPVLAKHYPLVAERPWSFLKAEGPIERSLPHTRGPHIVLSDQAIRSGSRLARLLLHEQLHVVQRKYPERFESLYTDVWGFAPMDPPTGNAWLRRHEMHNPDGTDYWIFPLDDEGEQRWIWPTLILDPENRDVRVVAFEVDRGRSRFRIRISENGEPLFTDVRDVEAFSELFPFERDPYHPNEVAAEAFSRVVFEDMRSGVPSPETNVVRSWFRENLGLPKAATPRP